MKITKLNTRCSGSKIMSIVCVKKSCESIMGEVLNIEAGEIKNMEINDK